MMAATDDLPSDYQQIYNNQSQREGEINDGRILDKQYKGEGYMEDGRVYDNQWKPKINLRRSEYFRQGTRRGFQEERGNSSHAFNRIKSTHSYGEVKIWSHMVLPLMDTIRTNVLT